jgi:UDPglucose--hexose-1-phosphate uridylyltransferase
MPESLAPEKAVAANPAVASLYQAEQARGKCYVICFSPRHDLTIAQMTIEELQGVISAWQELYTEVSKELDWIKYIQIFENKGSSTLRTLAIPLYADDFELTKVMGCSNPHPHGQAWSLDHIPSEALTIHESLRTYQEKNGSNLLLDYAQAELSSNSPRIVVNGEHFAALVPYWATWPYEALICPTNRQIPNITSLEEAEKRDLADVLRKLTCRYDNRAYAYRHFRAPTHA